MTLDRIVKSLAVKVLKPGMVVECMNDAGRSYCLEKGKTYTVGNPFSFRELTLKELGLCKSFHATRFRKVNNE